MEKASESGLRSDVTRSCALAAAALWAASGVGACSPVQTAGARRLHPWTIRGTLRFADGEEPDTLNPLLSGMVLVHDLGALTMGYLFVFGPSGQPVPSLATEVPTQRNGDISRDGKTIVYKLRHGVVWHDGAPFTSADVVFTVHTILDPKTNVLSRNGWDYVRRVDAPDAHTVVFHLTRPYAAFMNTYFTPAENPAILPQHLLQGVDVNHAPYNALPVGLGPFRFVRWSRGTEVVMEAFDRWWGGKPQLQRIVFKVIPNENTALEELRTHELDAYVRFPSDRLDQLAGLHDIAVTNYPTTTYGHFDYNVQSPLLSDARVRRALTRAIPLDLMWAKIDHRSGRRDWTPIPRFSWAYDPGVPRYPYDLRAAARGLGVAGWRLGPDGLRHKNGLIMRLRVAGNIGNPGLDARVLLMQSSFKQVGVAVEYFRYPTPTLFGSYATGGIVATRKYDMASYAWQLSPDPNLANQYTCANISPKGLNYLGYCNPRFDAYVDDSLVTYDRARRKRDLVAAQRILGADEPTVILSQRVDHIAYNDDLTGLDPSPAMVFWNPQNLAMGAPPLTRGTSDHKTRQGP